jgi:hypothetical protein
MISKTNTTSIVKTNPPHNGAVTHHHDQSILFVNFNPKNNRKRSPKKPTPLELELFFDILNVFY